LIVAGNNFLELLLINFETSTRIYEFINITNKGNSQVFAEVFRLLKPGGVFIVSFSNRMFYEKAIRVWREGTTYSRVQLVVQYFQSVEGFTEPEVVRKLPTTIDDKSPPLSWVIKLFGLFSASDPFYAVIAYRNFKPIHDD